MAYVKGHGLRGNVQRAIDYIVNEAKTRGGNLVSWNSISGTTPSTMGLNWDIRKLEIEKRDHRKKSDLVGYHIEQSFASGEIDGNEAHRIGQEFVEQLTQGEYDYVIATHVDQNHIHNHIIINPINNKNDAYWNIYWKKDLKKFRAISDELCIEHGLSIIEHPKQTNRTYYEWMMSRHGDTERDIVRKMLDELVDKVTDYSQLKTCLLHLGFQVEDGLEDEMNEFSFTANNKLFIKEDEISCYLRIPYKTDIIAVPKNLIEWTEDKKTMKISLNDDHYPVFDKDGTFLKEQDIDAIKADWEDKGKRKRKGLRIKPPGYKSFIRCDKLVDPKNNNGYSLDDIINRIHENDVIVMDDSIRELLIGGNDHIKEKMYSRANIKEKWNESTIYRTARQERYFQWRTKTVMTKYNAIAYEKYMNEQSYHLDEYKEQKKELTHELSQCGSDLRKAENTYRLMQEKSLSGLLEISDDELKKFVEDTIEPMQKIRLNLKAEIAYLNRQIKELENYENKKKDEKSKIYR